MVMTDLLCWQVAAARRAVPNFMQEVINAFNEEPAVQRVGEVRSKSGVWDEGGLAPLPQLLSLQ